MEDDLIDGKVRLPKSSIHIMFQFKALFPYGGQHEDELSFETGDTITLISKVNKE